MCPDNSWFSASDGKGRSPGASGNKNRWGRNIHEMNKLRGNKSFPRVMERPLSSPEAHSSQSWILPRGRR
jgi:hypothetical protein